MSGKNAKKSVSDSGRSERLWLSVGKKLDARSRRLKGRGRKAKKKKKKGLRERRRGRCSSELIDGERPGRWVRLERSAGEPESRPREIALSRLNKV